MVIIPRKSHNIATLVYFSWCVDRRTLWFLIWVSASTLRIKYQPGSSFLRPWSPPGPRPLVTAGVGVCVKFEMCVCVLVAWSDLKASLCESWSLKQTDKRSSPRANTGSQDRFHYANRQRSPVSVCVCVLLSRCICVWSLWACMCVCVWTLLCCCLFMWVCVRTVSSPGLKTFFNPVRSSSAQKLMGRTC